MLTYNLLGVFVFKVSDSGDPEIAAPSIKQVLISFLLLNIGCGLLAATYALPPTDLGWVFVFIGSVILPLSIHLLSKLKEDPNMFDDMFPEENKRSIIPLVMMALLCVAAPILVPVLLPYASNDIGLSIGLSTATVLIISLLAFALPVYRYRIQHTLGYTSGIVFGLSTFIILGLLTAAANPLVFSELVSLVSGNVEATIAIMAVFFTALLVPLAIGYNYLGRDGIQGIEEEKKIALALAPAPAQDGEIRPDPDPAAAAAPQSSMLDMAADPAAAAAAAAPQSSMLDIAAAAAAAAAAAPQADLLARAFAASARRAARAGAREPTVSEMLSALAADAAAAAAATITDMDNKLVFAQLFAQFSSPQPPAVAKAAATAANRASDAARKAQRAAVAVAAGLTDQAAADDNVEKARIFTYIIIPQTEAAEEAAGEAEEIAAVAVAAATNGRDRDTLLHGV